MPFLAETRQSHTMQIAAPKKISFVFSRVTTSICAFGDSYGWNITLLVGMECDAYAPDMNVENLWRLLKSDKMLLTVVEPLFGTRL